MPDPRQPQDISALDLDPDTVHNLLQMESQGQIPEGMKPHVERARGLGLIPPPLITGGAQNMVLPKGEHRPLQTPPDPEGSVWDELGARAYDLPHDVNEWIKSTGKSTVESMSDPTVAVSTGGGMLAGGRKWPVGAGVAGLFGAGAEAAKEGYHAAKEGRAGQYTPALVRGFTTGAVGEAGARVLGGAGKVGSRAEIDPLGQATREFFEGDVGAHQLTESPTLDFMANVAASGLGGRKGMQNLTERQGAKAAEALTAEAAKIHPNLRPAEESGGQALKETLGANLDDLRAQSKGAYSNWLQNWGQVRAVDPTTGKPVGPTVQKLHQTRSNALEQGREALRNGDGKAAAAFNQQARAAERRMQRLLPGNAMTDYESISSWYRPEINRLNNDMVYDVREGMKGDDVLNNLLHDKLKSYTPLGSNVSLNNDQLVNQLRVAAGPSAWKQTQADLIHELVNQSIDKEGLFRADRLSSIVNGLSPNTQKALFGPAGDRIQEVMAVLGRSQELRKGGPGQLAIAVRQPSAILNAATHWGPSLLGLGAAGAGSVTGHPAAAVAGSTIIAAPYVFMKLLTSPKGQMLLVRAANTSGPAQDAAKAALTRYISQLGANQAVPRTNPNQADTNPIPEPPR